jgi:hypothetical protein
MSTRVETYSDAKAFLERTREQLESNEAANSLMLGICGQLLRDPQRYASPPCLKTVEDEGGLVLAAVMTSPYKLIAYGHHGDLAGGSEKLVEDLVSGGWQVPGVLGPSAIARCIVEMWKEATGLFFGLELRQAVHELREVRNPVPDRGRLRVASVEEGGLVGRWNHGFKVEILGESDHEEALREAERLIEAGNIYLWEDPAPVSMAMPTRPTRNGISVSLVYTPPEFRGRGYATACVGELSRLLLSVGWTYCALFANLENAAANRVYRKVGYEPICDFDEYVFLQGDERDSAAG